MLRFLARVLVLFLVLALILLKTPFIVFSIGGIKNKYFWATLIIFCYIIIVFLTFK